MAGPLLGRNANISYRGQTYHVQTEDSGVKRPHIWTHLFAEGGRIVASRKAPYDHLVGTDAYPKAVLALMAKEHAAMVEALKAGSYDKDLGLQPIDDAHEDRVTDSSDIDVDALERAAERILQASPLFKERQADRAIEAVKRRRTRSKAGRYRSGAHDVSQGITGTKRKTADTIRDKSLDEVILGYLDED